MDFSLQGNWVDLVSVAILIYFVSEAWTYGFWIILADFLGFLLSLVLSLRLYSFASILLRENFSLPHSVSNALGFLLTASLLEAIIGFFLTSFIKKIPYRFWKKPWINLLATFPALGQGVILISFILTLVIGLPISPNLKSDITSSRIGGLLVQKTSGLEVYINKIFGGLIEDSLTYLTIKPGSRESIPLNVYEEKLSIDEKSEAEMFRLVNEERKKRGIKELVWRPEAVAVARAHAEDMWKRQYFGHISPDGKDVGDRLEEAGVEYRFAGENLALAPTLQTAHNGLMNSEGHRANILEPGFRRIGIGVVDNGVYGKMFVQIFTD